MNKKILASLDNNFNIIEYEDVFGNIVRVLASKKAVYSVSLTGENKNKLYFPYTALYDFPIQINPNIKNTLVLGAGCFSYPKYYISEYKDKCMDTVEIDKHIIDISYKYFFLDELYNEYDKNKKRLKIYNEDAQQFINNCKKVYDNIFLDIFDDNESVDSFLTDDFINKITHILSKKGIFSINYIINEGKIDKYDKFINNLKNHFKYIIGLTIDDGKTFKNGLGNIYILCSNYNYDMEINDEKIKRVL